MITALVLQTWFDISIQSTGSVVNAFAIAMANGRSVTDLITAGEKIVIPKELISLNREIVFFESKNIIPATGITKDTLEQINPQLGIGTMAIESTFIVR
ncbi:hypothetical protein [Flavobacterium sp.]|uniref:hypothetical protein n=1 Tax=Flavobacterium sp. TaxID=239 RepID=UPI002617FE5C|nr:hypothetical protein [Flavobacterium sp.]